MHTYGHINIGKMTIYPSTATTMRVCNIVLHSIKTLIKHIINGEVRLYIAAYIFES